MMYATGKAMWANVSVPNTRFEPHKYMVTILTDEDTASDLEAAGLKQSTDRAGNAKYDEPAFMFSKTAIRKKDGVANKAPKLIDADGNPLDCLIGNKNNMPRCTFKSCPATSNGRSEKPTNRQFPPLILYTLARE